MPPLTPANDAIRAMNVTASECGALMGDHPYTTPEQIWDRLCSPFALTVEQNEQMQNGSFMEAAILRLAEKRLGIRARLNSRTYVHPKVRLCATPDALVRDMGWIGDKPTTESADASVPVERGAEGMSPIVPTPGLVEIKLSGRVELWRSVPEYVEWQVRAQMACTGRQTAAVCVFVGAGLRTFLLEREADKEAALLGAVDAFWINHVVTGIRPDPRPVEEPVFYLER